MLQRFRSWLHNTPRITNPIQKRQVPVFQVILLGLVVMNVLLLIVATTSFLTTHDTRSLIPIIGVTLSIVANSIYIYLARKGFFHLAVSLTVGSMILSVFPVVTDGLQSSWVIFITFLLPIVIGGLIGSRRLLWISISVIIVFMLVVAFNEHAQLLAVSNPQRPPAMPFIEVVSFAFMIGFAGFCFDRFTAIPYQVMQELLDKQHELEQVRASQEHVITERTSELRSSLHIVEQREQQLAQTLQELQRSQAVIVSLSAPIIPVLSRVLMVPLIGALDSERAGILTHNVLQAVEQQRARAVILDITGVDVIDTQVAQVLLHTATALKLLGAQVLLVGIRPEVAQTIVALGVDMSSVATYSNLQEAVTAFL